MAVPFGTSLHVAARSATISRLARRAARPASRVARPLTRSTGLEDVFIALTQTPMARPLTPSARRGGLSLARIGAVLRKELVQLRRDRLTFAMMIGVPIMQLILFGYAINADPRHLPAAVVALDQSPLVRSIVRAAENTSTSTSSR